jgi:hypothetical protein
MKILVTGSRKWRDLEAVKEMLLAAYDGAKTRILVHGRARGADACAHFAAEDIGGVDIRPYPAGWETHGSAAGPIRNQQMLDEEHQKREPIDLCLAFPLADSIGTWDMVTRCLTAGIKVECCTDDEICLARFAALRKQRRRR